jgi:hypothetical protein
MAHGAVFGVSLGVTSISKFKQNVRQRVNKSALLEKTLRYVHTQFMEKVSVLVTLLTRFPGVLGSDLGYNVVYIMYPCLLSCLLNGLGRHSLKTDIWIMPLEVPTIEALKTSVFQNVRLCNVAGSHKSFGRKSASLFKMKH